MGSMSENMQPQESWGEAGGRLDPSRGARRSGTRLPPGSESGLGQHGREILERAVKSEVIPRLVALPWLARAVPAQALPTPALPILDAGAVQTLVGLCLGADPHAAAAFIANLHQSGIAAHPIFDDLLTPAARHLGVMWEDDTCTFADVTIGVLRLQNAQRALAARPLTEAPPALGAPRALLMPVPGEQHTFGLSIVLDYFTCAGWDARLGPAGSRADALALVRKERTELVGLSFACDDFVPQARVLVTQLRDASANKRLIVMVGGPAFTSDPGLAAAIGADATATDGHGAVLCANDLLNGAPEAHT